MKKSNKREWMKAGLQYFAMVFGAGFALGPIRILWLVPRTGTRTAELLETPVMIAVVIAAARFVVRRLNGPRTWHERLSIGMLALGLLMSAEIGVGVWLRGIGVSEYFFGRDPVSGAAHFIALGLFAVMPLLVCRRQKGEQSLN
jgi:hypothetical protein